MWVRGLKYCSVEHVFVFFYVAPYVGAWVEIVALPRQTGTFQSHPMRVRGLKLVALE